MKLKHLLWIPILLAATVANAATYYVAHLGSDSNNGITVDTPFLTFSHALSVANTDDTITFEDGLFDSSNDFLYKAINKRLTINSLHGRDFTELSASGTNEGWTVLTEGTRISGITFANFVASANAYGGALRAFTPSMSIDNCKFFNNRAYVNSGIGGAIWASGCTLQATNCNFEQNSAGKFGGVVYCNVATFNATGCTFRANNATYGGVICADGYSHANLSSCLIEGNRTVFYGRADAGPGASLSLTGCNVVRNKTINTGFVPIILMSGPITVSGTTFTDNYGSALLQLYAGGTITNSSFIGNYSGRPSYIASTINALGTFTYTVQNCKFIANDFTAGAVFNEGDMAMEYCTFYGNRSTLSGYGGGLTTYGAHVGASNCIFWDNEGPAGDVGSPNAGDLHLSNSDVQHPFYAIGTGNIALDPQFLNVGAYDVRLSPTTPCGGAALPLSDINTDITGRTRHPKPTIGCYEVGTDTPVGTAVGPDGNKRVLWNDTLGKVWLWKITPTNASSSATYPTPIGGTAVQLLVGPKNEADILFTNGSDNSLTILTVPTTGATSSKRYLPTTTDLKFKSASISPDGTLRILWTNPAGKFQLLSVTSAGVQSHITYGPYIG